MVGYQAGDAQLSIGLMNCLYAMVRVVSSLLKLFCNSGRMMFSFLFAMLVMLRMRFEKVKRVTYAKSRIFGDLFKGIRVLFSFT